MSEQTKVWLTKEGIMKLREELEYVENVKLPDLQAQDQNNEVIEQLDYYSSRVKKLKALLDNAKVM